MTRCVCNHSVTGRCFIRTDNDWRKRNLDVYAKWMNGQHKLGHEVFRSEEQRRLAEKAIEMQKCGIDDMRSLECEIQTEPLAVKLEDIYG